MRFQAACPKRNEHMDAELWRCGKLRFPFTPRSIDADLSTLDVLGACAVFRSFCALGPIRDLDRNVSESNGAVVALEHQGTSRRGFLACDAGWGRTIHFYIFVQYLSV